MEQGVNNMDEIKKQLSEFSNKFDTLLNSYSLPANFGEGASKINLTLDEYEKSVFLTKAENELFINLYNGKNVYGDYFEGTEELRRYLDTLVRDANPTKLNDDSNVLSEMSVKYQLPEDLAFITLERVTYSQEDDDCINGFNAYVYPVTQDEYARVKDNPFRGPTKYKVLRLDKGNKVVELIPKYPIGDYYIRYLKKPEPIILVDLTGTGLFIEGKDTLSATDMNPILFDAIITRAVTMAVQSKSIGIPTNNKSSE